MAYRTNYLDQVPTELIVDDRSGQRGQLNIDLGHGDGEWRRRSINPELAHVHSSGTGID